MCREGKRHCYTGEETSCGGLGFNKTGSTWPTQNHHKRVTIMRLWPDSENGQQLVRQSCDSITVTSPGQPRTAARRPTRQTHGWSTFCLRYAAQPGDPELSSPGPLLPASDRVLASLHAGTKRLSQQTVAAKA
ncbi:hypothetical protein RRG08_057081 [Elysia crispata]|uniref:Uncharacterized protein n=1 Tax=Elysia crispata TaxID=231223 RepID=A0AAE1ALK0_9GAST|nr:hypothetical protein RRG08_057081 [Elysia crispata]